MEIKVTGENHVNFYSSRIYEEVPHVVISITSCDCDDAYLSTSVGRKDTLRLKFDDIAFSDQRLLDPVGCKSFMHFLQENMDKLNDKEKIEAKKFLHIIFNESDARIIKEFVDIWKDKVDMIICHCKAGISRSSATAAALSEYLECGSMEDYFDNPNYSPNQYVYNVLSMVLKGKELDIKNIDI